MNRPYEQQLLEAYDEHADALFRFAYACSGDRERSRDAVQETFLRTLAYVQSGNEIRQWRPFLYRTLRNIVIDGSRRPNTASLESLRETGWDAADPQAMSPEAAAELALALRLVQQLEPAYREAVVLRHVHGLMPREIADITGENENAVSVRITRGMQHLRELLGITT